MRISIGMLGERFKSKAPSMFTDSEFLDIWSDDLNDNPLRYNSTKWSKLADATVKPQIRVTLIEIGNRSIVRPDVIQPQTS